MGVVSGADHHTGALGWHPENKDWPGLRRLPIRGPYILKQMPAYIIGSLSVFWFLQRF